jgi:polyhydroxyalkanoate synthesis regulator protein
MRQIRKYANHKHYDEETSAYVQVVDLSDLIASGEQIKVVDDVSGRDITLETMARALYDRLRLRDRDAETSLTQADLARVIRKVAGRKVGE